MPVTPVQALAAGVSTPTRAYTVEIEYREPSYEARHGARDRPYRWRYVIHAASADDARRRALVEFRHIAAISPAGWSREIVSVHVRALCCA